MMTHRMTRRRFLHALGAGALAGGAVGGYAFGVEPVLRLIVKRWRISHPHWRAGLGPLRIACLADLHAVTPWMPPARIRAIVDKTLALKPDLIVLLGDYVDGVRRFRTGLVPVAEWSAALGRLEAPLGVFAVLGNHDWWLDVEAVRTGLNAAGIRVLENEAVPIGKGKARLWLAGLGDQLAYPLPGGGYRGADDLPGTLAQAASDDPIILLAHEPDIFVQVPSRVTLTLCGHTHGGQVRLPFLGRPVIPSAYGQRFAYGHIVEGGRHLVVSAGLGVSVLPVRFMAPPEITLVTLAA